MSPLFIRALSVSVADTLRQNFVELGRVRGLPPRQILTRHVLRNAAVPILNLFGVQVGALLGGVLIVEYIFDYPGLGLLTVQAVLQRDFPVIQGVAILSQHDLRRDQHPRRPDRGPDRSEAGLLMASEILPQAASARP